MRSALVYRRCCVIERPASRRYSPAGAVPEGAHAAGWYPRASVEHPVRPTLRRASGRRLAVLLVGALARRGRDRGRDRRPGRRPTSRPTRRPPPRRTRSRCPAVRRCSCCRCRRRAGLTGEVRRSAVEDAARSRPEDVDAQLALVGGRPGVRAPRGGRGRARSGRRPMAPDDPRVAAARLTLGYDPASPQATIDGLATLVEQHPDAALARFQLGVAQLWAGHADTAQSTLVALRDARGRGHLRAPRPTTCCTRAWRPGYPPYFTSFDPDAGSIEELQAIAAGAGDRRRRRSCSSAPRCRPPAAATTPPRRSRARSPSIRTSVEAQVARAVNAFDKDDPSGTFAVLGPLAADHPDDPCAALRAGRLPAVAARRGARARGVPAGAGRRAGDRGSHASRRRWSNRHGKPGENLLGTTYLVTTSTIPGIPPIPPVCCRTPRAQGSS